MEIMKRTVRMPAEVRDPRAATITNMPRVNSRFNSRSDVWDAENAIEWALYANVYVYACARARAQDLSTLPIRVGADPDKPKDFDPRHPLAKLLGPAPGGPTMNISARRLIAWSLMQYDITGRMVWEIARPVNNRRDGVPFELWPIPAQYIKPRESTGGAQWFTGFEYVSKAHQKRELTADQVMYHWRPAADDWRKPESLLQAARLNVSIAVMQDRYDYAFLVNDARPAAVVVHEEFQAKRERDSFRRQFLESHRGPDNAGKVAFVEASRDGATPKDSLLIQQLGLSQRDAEFINRMENQIRAICVAMSTPLSRLADSSRRTYSNAEVEAKHYWRTAIKPAGVEFAEALNIQLMPLLGDSNNVCWFDTTGIPELEPPRRFAVGDIPDLLDAEVITRNEARTSIELAEIGPEGDEFSSGRVESEPESDPVVPPQRLAPVVPLQRSPENAMAHATPGLQHMWSNTLRALRAAQNSAILRRADGKRGRQAARSEDLTGLFDRTYWYNQAHDRFAEVFGAAYTLAVSIRAATNQEVYHTTGSPEARAWINRQAAIEAARTVDATMSLLRVADVDTLEVTLLAGVVEVDYMDAEQALRGADTVARVGSTVVDARIAADTVVMLANGEIDLETAMACLG